jgi:DNA-binding IclR family transcriptional regulator
VVLGIGARSRRPHHAGHRSADDPGVRLRELGERVGITERAAHRIVVELAAAGYITRQRNGRRNQYTINAQLPSIMLRRALGALARAHGEHDERSA